MASERIAIFPLSNIVLFPRVHAPLHLFEPRYRQMIVDVLADNRRIGMVVVPPEHAQAMAGDPPVYPIGCAGSIVQDERMPDGRYNIVLAGERRFRIVSEAQRPREQLYRSAEVSWLDDPLPSESEGQVAELRGRIELQVRSLIKHSDPQRAASLDDGILSGADPAVFINTLCNTLAFQTAEKQGLLEADGILQRFEKLEGLLAFRIAETRQPSGGSGQTH